MRSTSSRGPTSTISRAGLTAPPRPSRPSFRRRWRTRLCPQSHGAALGHEPRYGFTASKTQQITQDLRDKYKAITYNRSDSQYLKEEHFAQAPVVLPQAMRNLGVSWELDYSIHSKAFNEKNVTAHHGIIPQEVDAPVDR